MSWDKKIAEEKFKKAMNSVQEFLIYCSPFYFKQDSGRANNIGRELSYFVGFIEKVEKRHKTSSNQKGGMETWRHGRI